MNTKQQQLLYDKGITNVPSDILCSDNALEESIGMIYDDGEHRVIQKPSDYITSAVYDSSNPDFSGLAEPDMPTILYVHKFNNEERFIGHMTISSVHRLVWGVRSGSVLTIKDYMRDMSNVPYVASAPFDTTSVGKTLIMIFGGDIHYWIWKQTKYKPLGNVIPSPKVEFALLHETDNLVKNSGTGDVFEFEDHVPVIGEEKQEDYNNLVVGLYAKNKKAICQKKGFCEPFLIRTAVKLYDESYIHISAPQVLFPSVTSNSYPDELRSSDDELDRIQLITRFSKLVYKNLSDFKDWEDIVKDVTVFISSNINIYDTGVDQNFRSMQPDEILIDGVYREIIDGLSEYRAVRVTPFGWYQLFTLRDAKEIEDDIVTSSLFYKIAEIGLSGDSQFHDMSEKIYTHTLENLSTQEALEYDDYYSYSKLYPEFMYSYNSRLNISRVSRGFYEGFGSFLPLDQSDPQTYRFYVTIRTETEDVTVMHEEVTKQKQGIYFYYPDSRAKHVKIFKNGNTKILDAELKEHTGLNGAYYIAGLPSVEDEPSGTSDTQPSYNNDAIEALSNYILQSEVNNPWVFLAKGYFKVGTGKILGMSSITQALSEGQYGAFPLIVFSESGIWALSVADTGYYSSIHPMSREVCNNPDSITQTDGAVFFSSEKGLMVVVGSNVKCVSEQLSGMESDFQGEVKMGNFRDFLKGCFMAYDYRNSLIWIFNNSRQLNPGYCYVYAIKSGTFGKYNFLQAIENVVNNYPDHLLQSGSAIFSLTERENINLDPSLYSGLMITRPMKLENGLALKTIMELKNLRQMQGTLKLRIFASNNLDNWFELSSLGGVPWKYYRFRFDLSDMKATDRFAGTVLITQERRTDKLR